MRTPLSMIIWSLACGCAASPRPFPNRDPLMVDTDKQPVSVTCRPDDDKKNKTGQNCAPAEYVSPFVWDQLDNLAFARWSRGLSIQTTGEARNANSMDEVADSAWFTNNESVSGHDDGGDGACKPEDMLPPADQVKDGEWVIDHGKDNGSTLGFRVDIPGKGKYMLKADDEGKPERASAASVIGAAIYDAVGFNTTCEQVVVIKKSMLKLTPDLKVFDNEGISHPFDDAALDKVLKSTTQVGDGKVRLQASKWLPGYSIGPFRYIGTREDDPNDVIDHADRRELRGSRLIAAWLDHWDAREQNSMDVWFSVDEKNKKSSPGYVRHYILDTSDTLGGEVGVDELSRRLGYTYEFSAGDIARALVTLGAEERRWDRAHYVKGEERFAYYTDDEFDPNTWVPFYPNPAFLRMSERDAAWMTRKIAKFSPADVRKFVELGHWSRPVDVEYLTKIMIARQRKILYRYLTRLSPLGDVHTDKDRICATDFARLRELEPEASFRYTIVQLEDRTHTPIPAEVAADGVVCWKPHPGAGKEERATFDVRDGTAAGPLIVHTYDLGAKGYKVVGLTRKEP